MTQQNSARQPPQDGAQRQESGQEQNWQAESYRDFTIYVTPLPHAGKPGLWDYSVRITQPGEDAGTEAELAASAGDDADFPSPTAAVEAGLIKGHAMVDALLK